MTLKLHKDYDEKEFRYDKIENAWAAINGDNSAGRYFFIAHLARPLINGPWMAFLRRPNKEDLSYVDVPFDYEGFNEIGDADIAIRNRAYQELGWRITKIDADKLPVEVDKNLEELI